MREAIRGAIAPQARIAPASDPSPETAQYASLLRPTGTEEETNDRRALLDDAERPQDHDVPGGDRAAVQAVSGADRRRRAVQGELSENIAQQPHPGDRRS